MPGAYDLHIHYYGNLVLHNSLAQKAWTRSVGCIVDLLCMTLLPPTHYTLHFTNCGTQTEVGMLHYTMCSCHWHLFIKSVPCMWDNHTVSTIGEQEAWKHTQYSHEATGWMIQGWMPDRGKSCCSYSCCPDWLWGSPTPIFKGYWGALTLQVKQPGHEIYVSPPPSTKVKDVCSVLLLPLYSVMVWCRGTNLLLL